MGRFRLAAVGILLGVWAVTSACTSGTTPECTDAACLVVGETGDAAGQGGPEDAKASALADGAADTSVSRSADAF